LPRFRVKSFAAAADTNDMSTQISAPIRIVALVGVVMALALGAWVFLAGQKTSGSTTSSAGPVAQHPVAAAKAVASKLSAHNEATAAGTPDAVSPAKPRPVTHPALKPAVAAPGAAPTTIASVLRHHRVAVVLVYDPQAEVDKLSLGETQLGAERAHAGFLRVDVLEERQVLPFAKTYGVLQVPTVLFFARPGKVVQKLTGYADQDTVAQAALNAARGLVAPAG
jgi:thiol:disulfide interchange protein